MDFEEKVINDLATLPNLNEEIILNHLKARYNHNLIYVKWLQEQADYKYLNEKSSKWTCSDDFTQNISLKTYPIPYTWKRSMVNHNCLRTYPAGLIPFALDRQLIRCYLINMGLWGTFRRKPKKWKRSPVFNSFLVNNINIINMGLCFIHSWF